VNGFTLKSEQLHFSKRTASLFKVTGFSWLDDGRRTEAAQETIGPARQANLDEEIKY
jgi:hypothetical protein